MMSPRRCALRDAPCAMREAVVSAVCVRSHTTSDNAMRCLVYMRIAKSFHEVRASHDRSKRRDALCAMRTIVQCDGEAHDRSNECAGAQLIDAELRGVGTARARRTPSPGRVSYRHTLPRHPQSQTGTRGWQ